MNAPSKDEIFQMAAEIRDSGERSAFLKRVCGSDLSLRAEIEELLAHDSAKDSLLDQTAPGIDSGDQEINSQIGPFKIREQIGEGGMGVVYVAEQTEPVQRKVALKLIKPGMDTKEVIARFEAERQALAFMEHPNIARVFDAGTTETGRSYFVMELVRGIPITRYCDELTLSPRERLELFMTVCDAVQHAHQKGIIHRDIKPSNVLVTQVGAKPVVKVIDFGLAKATSGQRLTDKTVYTGFMRLMGTPLYMSPEQAGLSNLDVDTRSDIYSLGILLYQLLTGTTPLDKTDIQRQAYDEVCRRIREIEAPRPSARISTLRDAQRSTIAQQRQIEPKRLRQLLHGDLDRVVLKALEKDRDRRYETAKDLAADIDRFLHHQPVQAVPPSQLYLARKYFRRHKVAILTTGVIFAMSILAAAVSTWQAVRAINAERVAASAEHEQSRLRQVAETAAAAERRQRLTAQAMELRARQMAYSSDLSLAKHMVDMNRLGRASDLLNRTKPLPGQLDLRGWEWRYLWQASKADQNVELCNLENAIYSLSCSYDEKLAAIGEWETGGVTVWDLQAGVQVQHWPSTEHHSLVAFSPVEAILAYSTVTSTADRTEGHVVLWDYVAGSRVAQLPLVGLCKGLSFAKDGRTLATASAIPAQKREEGEICVWQIPSGKRLSAHAASFHSNEEAIPFAASGDLSMTAYTLRHRIHVLDLATGDVLWKGLASDSTPVIALQFSPDGETLASSGGFYDTSIRLWESQSGRELKRLQGHSGWVGDLVFWPDGTKLASASADESISIWDLTDLDDIPSPRRLGGHQAEVWRAALLPDGRTLLTGSNDGVVKVWDSSIPQTRRERIALPVDSVGVGIAADSRTVVTVNFEGVVSDVPGPDFQRTEPRMQLESPVKAAKFWFSGNDERLAVRTDDGFVEVYDLRRRVRLHAFDTAAGQLVGFSKDGKGLLVLLQEEDAIEEWDLSRGLPLRSWPRPPGTSSLMKGGSVISPDQQLIASARFGGELLLCDLRTGSANTMNLNTKQVHGLAISPDNKLLAVTTGLGVTRLFEIPTLRQIAEFDVGGLAMTFSRDGQRLAITGDRGLRLWDVKARQELLWLHCEFSPQCEFSPDGSLLVARDWNNDLTIWRAPHWSEIEGSGDR